MSRNAVDLDFNVGGRQVRVRAMDAVGPEDVFENAMLAVLHKYKTGEDLLTPAPREIKDFILKQNLSI